MYMYYRIKQWYKKLVHWYNICFKNPYYREHFKNTITNYYPWDYSFFFESQYDWLKYSIYYYENNCNHLTEEIIQSILNKMKLAKKMLDIFQEKVDLYKIEEDPSIPETEPYYMRIKHTCIPYVNLKNANRFSEHLHSYNEFPEELYRQKALNIYFKIIKEYSTEWWD